MGTPVEINPLQLGGGGYQISRSVRLRSSASAYFSRTPSVTGSLTTYTLSCWVKRGQITSASDQAILSSRNNGGNGVTYLHFDTSDKLHFYDRNSSLTVQGEYSTNAVFRDPSAWYHVVCVVNTTQATAANRLIIYVNGVQQTLTTSTAFAQNTTTLMNASGQAEFVGSMNPTYGAFFDGYLAEINFIDGQALTASSFGYTDSNGIWQPKAYTGTYGTNGFYLKFTDNSAATAAAIGKDYSGNGNNWTPNNISVTAGVTYDSMIDSPTIGYAASNYCTYTPLAIVVAGGGTALATLNGGNLDASSSAANFYDCYSTFNVPNSGKWYFEWNVTTVGTNHYLGIASRLSWLSASRSYQNNGNKIINGTGSAYGATYTSGDVIGCAIDMDVGTLVMYKNNTSQGTLASDLLSSLPAEGWAIIAEMRGTAAHSVNFGQRPFSYTPPTGFKALNTYNLPAATINNGATVMAASLYTGTGAAQSIVNSGNNAAAVSFKPDFVWVKIRSTASSHVLEDIVRGIGKNLFTNLTNAEYTESAGYSITSFNSNGFSVGLENVGSGSVNGNGYTYVGWQWQAGQGTTSSNTNGSITSTVSVNQSAGFSIATYTGNGTSGTIGHGLGVAPKMVIAKQRTAASTTSWAVYHASLGATNYVLLNSTNASAALSTVWNNTTPTSSVFSVGSDGAVNATSGTYVAYCWSEVAGYSKFGSYTGNGSTDGPFVYCGFRPRYVLVKRTDSTSDWYIWDTSRDTYNVETATLLADTLGAETSATSIDGLSNGFKCRSATVVNVSSGTYIFAAFAENPFNISRAR